MNKLALETSLTDKQKYLLESVQSSSRHLLKLLNDILDFSKIEAGKLDIEYKNLKKDTVENIKDLKILIIEDNYVNQDLFKMILQKDNHRPVVAENGLKGLEILAHDKFDMIFMDIQMPVIDGITVCKIIKQNSDKIVPPKGRTDMNQKNSSYAKKNIKARVKNHLRSVYELNDDQIDELMSTAEKTLSKNLSSAKSALSKTNYEDLKFFAHAIKGSLLNLGLKDLSEKAKTIEISARDRKKINFHQLLTKLNNEIADLLET